MPFPRTSHGPYLNNPTLCQKQATMKLLLLSLLSTAYSQLCADVKGIPFRDCIRKSYYDGKRKDLGYDGARDVLYNNVPKAQAKSSLSCVYSGFQKKVSGKTENPMPINCEHTVPQSFFNKEGALRSDIHHLFPTHEKANSQRSHYPFAEIPDTQKSRWYGDGQIGIPTPKNPKTYAQGTNDQFEPPSAHKGNAARAIMYFYSVHRAAMDRHGKPVETIINPDLLKKWHEEDPVDDDEIKRNAVIMATQGNENPFITYPELVGNFM